MNAGFAHRTPIRCIVGSLALSFATLAVTVPALADDVSGAANAFSRAQKAELSGDFSSAAELYELADSLAPAPEALRSALRSRKAAGQVELAAVHAEELLDRYPNDNKSAELAHATLDDAAKKLMRVEVACRPTACTLLVDGAAASADSKEKHVVYLAAGKHDFQAAFGKAKADPQSTEGAVGDRAVLSFDAPPEPPPVVDTGSLPGMGVAGPNDQGTSRSRGLSPWYFVGGSIVTAGLGAATIWSGLDVLSAHDAYKKNQTTQAYNDGRSRELRTNVLIASTSVVAAATGIIAIFTDWGGKHEDVASRPGLRANASVSGSSAAFVIDGVY